MRLSSILRVLGALVCSAFALLASGCWSNDDGPYDAIEVAGLRLPARVEGRAIQAATKDGWKTRFWPGVNLGATIPGFQPGELAASREDYDRWLEGMGEIGARVVRVYTILRPVFYDALDEYNRKHADAPIFVIHGVWIPEEEFIDTQNAYAVTEAMDAEINDAVAVVHGDAQLSPRRGHADGEYTTDISRWLLGWSLGIEWDPYAVESTDRLNKDVKPYDGTYITTTEDATPMESWIAARLDVLAGLEHKRGWSRPLTFTNWLTVDPLDHPYEPLEQEDLVSVDATHLAATQGWPGGFFASYHAYPYYPDFLRLTPSYQDYIRPSTGKPDPYAGYLHELRAYHGDQAVMITEFGVPSGIGIAHLGPLGRDQGDHDEQEQGAMDADMLRIIREEGFAGGMLFEWVDEWFKLTWNTVDLELPSDRRQLWRNDLTNEEQFGIVAAEAGEEQVLTLDGDGDDWRSDDVRSIARSDGPVTNVLAYHDPQSLWLRLTLRDQSVLEQGAVTVGLDLREPGNKGLPGLPGVDPEADVALTLGPGRTAELRQAAWWEPTRLRYGLGFGYLDVEPKDYEPGSGVWVTPIQILNRPYVVPPTGELRPAEVREQGTLRVGAAVDDVRSLVAFGEGDEPIVEIRLPYAQLGFSDPSSKALFVQDPKGPVGTIPFEHVGIDVAAEGDLLETEGYDWPSWTAVGWRERHKAGFGTVADAMDETWGN